MVYDCGSLLNWISSFFYLTVSSARQHVQSRFTETRFAETLTLTPNPNPKP